MIPECSKCLCEGFRCSHPQPCMLQADYEMLSALDNGSLRRRTPVTEADVAALPTHIHCAHGKVCDSLAALLLICGWDMSCSITGLEVVLPLSGEPTVCPMLYWIVRCQHMFCRRASVVCLTLGCTGTHHKFVWYWGRGQPRVRRRRRRWRHAASAWTILRQGKRLKRCRACITSTQGASRSGSGSRGGLCAVLCARRLSLRDSMAHGSAAPSHSADTE